MNDDHRFTEQNPAYRPASFFKFNSCVHVMPEEAWAIILAAGKGTRLGDATAIPKQFIKWRGLPLYWHSLMTFARSGLDGAIIVVPEEWQQRITREIEILKKTGNPGIPVRVIPGGVERSDSVKCGLNELPAACARVLIHDAARPFMTASLARRIMQCLSMETPAVIPALAVKDTIKLVREDDETLIAKSLPRHLLRAVQTPQGFMVKVIKQAHSQPGDMAHITDDAMLWEKSGGEVKIVAGEESNIKITVPEDLRYLDDKLWFPCTAMGYDVHRFGKGRPFRLGGVAIPTDLEVVAHSDGDVLLHSLTDALLALAGNGDIGVNFPDTDPAYDGISSAVMLNQALMLFREKNIEISHVDLTVVAQKPKLAPWAMAISRNIARLLDVPEQMISFKATTEERLGFTGALEGIKAYAIVTGIKRLNQKFRNP